MVVRHKGLAGGATNRVELLRRPKTAIVLLLPHGHQFGDDEIWCDCILQTDLFGLRTPVLFQLVRDGSKVVILALLTDKLTVVVGDACLLQASRL